MSGTSCISSRIILVCALTVADAFNLFGSDCPTDAWTVDGDSCYLATPRFSYWAGAKTFCEVENEGHLVSVNSLKQNQYLMQAASALCQTALCPNRRVWLGLSPGPQGTWVWNDGTAYEWSRWRDGVPLNVPRGRDCVALDVDAGSWSAESCQNTYMAMCAKPKKNKLWLYVAVGAGGGVLFILLIVCCCCCCCGKSKPKCQGDNVSDVWSDDDSSYGMPTPTVQHQNEVTKHNRFSKPKKPKRTPSTSSKSGSGKPKPPPKPVITPAIMEMTPLTEGGCSQYVDTQSHDSVLERVHSIENRL